MSGKVVTALQEVDSGGKFVRKNSSFRHFVSNDALSPYPVEKGRYHLYINRACPWANRCSIVRAMKGLEEYISMSATHPTWQRTSDKDEHCGWVFRKPMDAPVTPLCGQGAVLCTDECIPDFVNQTNTVRELYNIAVGGASYSNKYTVPILWDKKTKTIVNNESSEIIRMLNKEFAIAAQTYDTSTDLYPEALQATIDETNEWVYANINNGVYMCGFATSQAAYDEAAASLFAHLDRVEDILSRQRYLCSPDRITEADIRLFCTLIRFDEVYVVYFKTAKKKLSEYPNIRNYMRELYQLPAVGRNVSMDHIRQHYFTSHPALNHKAIIPISCGVVEDMQQPHNRNYSCHKKSGYTTLLGGLLAVALCVGIYLGGSGKKGKK